MNLSTPYAILVGAALIAVSIVLGQVLTPIVAPWRIGAGVYFPGAPETEIWRMNIVTGELKSFGGTPLPSETRR